MSSNKPTTPHSSPSSKLLQWAMVLLLPLLISGWSSVLATPGIPNIPNHGDGNNDGIADVQQPNVASLPDKVTGQYITLELNNECTLIDIDTDLVETVAADYDPNSFFPQGLLYFDAQCPQTQVTLYFHGLHQLDQRWVLQKYGPQIPGDTSTIAWYQMPAVTFDSVIIDGQPVVRASYTLVDGELGDNTGVDGHLVDPIAPSSGTDVDNVISFLSKNYTASTQQGVATITVIRTGTQGALSITYATADDTAFAGQDYEASNGILSWADGEPGEKSFTVNLLGSATIGRGFTVTLDNLTGGNNPSLGINVATVTLTNDSVTPTTPPAEVNFISFSTNHFSARKQDGIAVLTVVRKGNLGTLSVDYATRDDTALAGRDYQPATGKLSWAEGDVSEKTITIILPSGAVANTEFLVTLSNLTTTGPTTVLGLNPTIVTINDTTPTPSGGEVGTETETNNIVSFSTKTVTASRRGEKAIVTVNRNGTQGSLSVLYTTTDNTAHAGRDYQPVTGMLSWADGERGDKFFTVTLFNTATVGSILNVTLSKLTLNGQPAPADTSLGIAKATLQITNEVVEVTDGTTPPPVTGASLVAFATNGYKVLKTEGVANLTVNRSGSTTGALSIDYATQNGTAIAGLDYQTTSGTLTWADGESGAKNLRVALLASATASNAFIVRLSNLTGASGKISGDTAVLTIVDNTSTNGGITSPGTGTSITSGGTTTPSSSGGDSTGTTPSSSGGTNDGIGAITETTPAPVVTSPASTTTSSSASTSNPNGEIYNAGGQELPPTVSEKGSISHATVLTDTENQGLLSNFTVVSGATVTGGDLTGTITNQGTLDNVEFLGISLSGGTLTGTVVNNSQVGGIIHDVTLAPKAILSGGKVGGTINAAPDSLITDVQLVANTTINGGTLAGNITGDSNAPATIIHATISAGTTLAYVTIVSPVELPDGVVIGPGVTLPPPAEIAVNNVLAPAQIQHIEANVLSTLPPEAVSTLDAEQIQQIPPPAFGGLTAEQSAALSQAAVATISGEQVAHILPAAFSGFRAEQVAVLPPETVAEVTSEQVSQIPPPAFQKVSAEQLAAVHKEALAGMTPAQFFYLPTESLGGLTSENMGGLSPAVINQFTATEVQALQPEAVQNLPAVDAGKLLVNLDTNKVSQEEAITLLPPGWKVNETGALTPPAGTLLTFQELPPPADLSPLVVIPPLPNLDSSFGIGGHGGATAAEGITATLQQTGLELTLSQDPNGIVQVEGTTVALSLMCPNGNLIQGDAQTPPAVMVTDGGFYQVTTLARRQFTMVPVPKDPENLSKVLQDSSVIVGKRGDVFLEVPNPVRQSGRAREVVLFDSLIEPAPTDFCEEIAGEMVCDFENAPPEQQPGIHEVIEEGLRQKTGVARKKKIVYTDGTAQILYPTVLSPGTFIDQAQTTLTGTEKVILQANGIFKIFYQGNRYLAIPNSEVKSRELKPDEEIKPSIVLQDDGHLIYTVTLERPSVATGTRQVAAREGEAREVLVFDLLMEPAPEEMCEEIAGLVVCDVENSADKVGK